MNLYFIVTFNNEKNVLKHKQFILDNQNNTLCN